jgi:DNA replication protein DnaC
MSIGPVSRGATSHEEAECRLADCLFVHWPSAVDGIKSDQWLVFEDCCVEYFVILDDIGAEHDPSGIGLEKLYLILNRRENMRTLITTNYSPEAWKGKFEKRIASRLFRNATHIDLSKVPDYSTL